MGAPIYRTASLREVEATALRAGAPLMQRAGEAAAALARRLLTERPHHPGRSALVVAGPGNNGGDAFECALRLKQAYYRVTLVFAGDAARLPPDARRACQAWQDAEGAMQAHIPDGANGADGANGEFDLVVDGLFGIGLTRPLEGQAAEHVRRINALKTTVLALDIPSGLNADSGAVMGCAVRATHTLSFIALKPGLLTLDGPDHCGALQCDALGLEPQALRPADGELLDESVLASLPRRPRNFHKGLAGDVGVIGGADGMLGAALLAGRAALKLGAGRVFVGFLAGNAPAVDFLQPELMLRDAAQVLESCPVLVLGPGMGTSSAAADLLARALKSDSQVLLDADALNLLGADAGLAALAAQRGAPTLITPHPAEAARLLGINTAAVQADRVAAAAELAQRFRCHALVKGNGSVLASPGEPWRINPTGNPGMASAGMGDALAGMLASLLAQNLPPAQALRLAVWLHGAAGDELLAAGRGPLGITASDVMGAAHLLANRHLSPPHKI